MRWIVMAICCVTAAIPAHAQVGQSATIGEEASDQDQQQQQQQDSLWSRPAQPGSVADSAVGEAGQRQTRDQAPGTAPLARISSRIQNRVQSRVRNRIDRNYDAQANATSPFAIAEDQARTANRQRR